MDLSQSGLDEEAMGDMEEVSQDQLNFEPRPEEDFNFDDIDKGDENASANANANASGVDGSADVQQDAKPQEPASMRTFPSLISPEYRQAFHLAVKCSVRNLAFSAEVSEIQQRLMEKDLVSEYDIETFELHAQAGLAKDEARIDKEIEDDIEAERAYDRDFEAKKAPPRVARSSLTGSSSSSGSTSTSRRASATVPPEVLQQPLPTAPHFSFRPSAEPGQVGVLVMKGSDNREVQIELKRSEVNVKFRLLVLWVFCIKFIKFCLHYTVVTGTYHLERSLQFYCV